MSIFSKLILTFTGIIATCALIIGALAINYALNVTSERIVDNTIQEKDLKDELHFKFQFPDGQVMDATLLDQNSANNTQIYGAKTAKGDIKIIVKDNELVIDPKNIIVTSEMIEKGTIEVTNLNDNSVSSNKIIDHTIQMADLAFDTISSINGIRSNGGNIDIIAGNGISISNDSNSRQITISSTGSGGSSNADTLDGNDSTYFTNASNLINGTLGTDLYSAYSDLVAEGRLNLDETTDLITLEQGDARFLKLTGGTITGDLSVNGDLTVGANLILDGSIQYDSIILAPDEATDTAIMVRQGDVATFAVTAQGNFFAAGNGNINGILGLKDIQDVNAYLKDLNSRINALSGRVDALEGLHINDRLTDLMNRAVALRNDVDTLKGQNLDVRISALEDIVKESKIESGILGCVGRVTPAEPLKCTYKPHLPPGPGPERRINSITATPISEHDTGHLFVILTGDPSGRTSATFMISTDIVEGQIIEGLSYIALLQ